RIASIRSPLWKGGGNVHGPQERDWSYNLPKKMKRGALRSALSERLREGNVVVLEAFKLDGAKTKTFVDLLRKLELSDGKTLIVDSLDNEFLLRASRNVRSAKVVNSYGLNIYDLLYHEKLVLSRAAVEELTELLDPNPQASDELKSGEREEASDAAAAQDNATEEAA
ncbi:MAG TPA: 50S ribosomal protein L4, partial [Pyrinomonadaceae bacterium]|nr:50S ribosomal protein L4 [Pyrinomonadaceae bacterium]